MKITYYSFAVLSLLIFVGCSADSRARTILTVGEYELSIPSDYIVDGTLSLLAPKSNFLERQSEAVIKIPLEDIGLTSQGKIEEPASLNIIVRLSIADQVGSYPKDVADAWKGAGLYLEKVVELDVDIGFIRVYPKSGHPVLWNYFKEYPESRQLQPAENMWVASCRLSPGTNFFSAKGADCVSRYYWKSLLVELAYPGFLVNQTDELKNAFQKILTDWVMVDN